MTEAEVFNRLALIKRNLQEVCEQLNAIPGMSGHVYNVEKVGFDIDYELQWRHKGFKNVKPAEPVL